MERMPGQYRFSDFIAYDGDGGAKCLVEVKSRTIRFRQYNEIMLSWSKFVLAHPYVFSAGIPFTVVFALLDSVVSYTWDGASMTGMLRRGGRTSDTRRDQDLEPCMYIPTESMRVLSVKPLRCMAKKWGVVHLMKS
jgi:hypothetical protein